MDRTSSARLGLPTGIQTFRKIRENGCYYVDKTAYALRLAQEGGHYFLSRPRRFGKSLFLDTLKELFECSEELFRGLAVHDRWDWDAPRPVVRLSFGSGNLRQMDELRELTMAQLDAIGEDAGIDIRYDAPSMRLRHLLRALRRQTRRRVVVLVDEYDKAILDALDEPTTAEANRDYLAGLYSTLKDCDEDIAFTFLTGVSKFSKASLFSTLNNLTDLTLHPRYSSICGYTERDMETVFGPELEGLERAKIQRWYNGYSWDGRERVYNPFDVLHLFDQRRFRNYWIKTGTPAFLPGILANRGFELAELSGRWVDEGRLEDFDIGRIGTAALLFQTGHLTIAAEHPSMPGRYRLEYPNLEVRQSLSHLLLDQLAGERKGRSCGKACARRWRPPTTAACATRCLRRSPASRTMRTGAPRSGATRDTTPRRCTCSPRARAWIRAARRAPRRGGRTWR